jgi:hypothetical protein
MWIMFKSIWLWYAAVPTITRQLLQLSVYKQQNTVGNFPAVWGQNTRNSRIICQKESCYEDETFIGSILWSSSESEG